LDVLKSSSFLHRLTFRIAVAKCHTFFGLGYGQHPIKEFNTFHIMNKKAGRGLVAIESLLGMYFI
jgi:hypothetical protein